MNLEKAFYLDMKDFNEKITEILAQKGIILSRARTAIFQVGNIILDDSDNLPPQTPFKLSGLRGSRFVEAVIDEGDNVSTQLGYNIVYAARVHEGEKTWKWTRTKVPSPGPKFIESKLIKRKAHYAKLIAGIIKEG